MAPRTRLDNINSYDHLPLSCWDQVAPRVYIPVGLCFSFPGPHVKIVEDNTSEQAEVGEAIKYAVERLSYDLPGLAGTLELGPGPTNDDTHVFLFSTEDDVVPCRQIIVPNKQTYEQLQANGFSASAFVNPRFFLDGTITSNVNGDGGVPVAQVQFGFIDGGLFLFLYLSHAIADASAVNSFVEALAGYTRGVRVEIPTNLALHLPNVSRAYDGTTEDDLIARCPEYVRLPAPTGPTQPYLHPYGTDPAHIKKSGKVFVFSQQKLDKLRDTLYGPSTSNRPSQYAVLAALSWAHIAQAQQDDDFMSPDFTDPTAIFSNPVNWSRFAYTENVDTYFGISNTYFGSSTIWARSKNFTKTDVLAAASDIAMLRRVADEIQRINKQPKEDEGYVDARTKLFQRVNDPRILGVGFDYRISQNLGFNDWRGVCADVEWCLPHVGGGEPVKADAVRRVQKAWNLAGGLLLPVKKGVEEMHLLVTLGEEAMGRLRTDKGWMKWCERVVE